MTNGDNLFPFVRLEMHVFPKKFLWKVEKTAFIGNSAGKTGTAAGRRDDPDIRNEFNMDPDVHVFD